MTTNELERLISDRLKDDDWKIYCLSKLIEHGKELLAVAKEQGLLYDPSNESLSKAFGVFTASIMQADTPRR